MKKLFALLLSVGTLSSVFAQDHSREIDRGHDGYGSVYNSRYNFRERDIQIERINHDFERRIEFVRTDPRLRRREKNVQVSMLERQRQHEIHDVMERFARGRNGHYDDRYASDNRRY